MSSPVPLKKSVAEPPALHDRAMDNLRFIRETMERASSFTAVPGKGMIGIGLTAIIAAFISTQRHGFNGWWIKTWLVEAAVALIIAVAAIRQKARARGESLSSAPTRKFLLSLSPPWLAAAVLTLVLYRAGRNDDIPGVWMLLYGAGVVTGGAFSVRVVPVMGLIFMATGTIALFIPLMLSHWLMSLTFGGLHIIFGWIIAQKYGG
jgi:hypothetical protein